MSRIRRLFKFGLIERYLFRTAFLATLACTLLLTAVIWITQALRELDLLTAKGQTVVMFLMVTALSLPALVTVIAPVALFIACVFTLNKLNSDSELIVISAAGAPPGTVLRPLLALSAVVCLCVGAMTIWIMPSSFRSLQDLLTRIRADVIANIIREGQFTTLDRGVVFHYRDKAGSILQGIFIQDRRDPDKVSVYLAERGQTIQSGDSSYLILERGSVQRVEADKPDSSIVLFNRYAIDLSDMVSAAEAAYHKPRERTTWDLIAPPPNFIPPTVLIGRYRAELHDRLAAPLYPLALAAIAFGALGTPRTTRQGRGLSMAAAVAVVAIVRGLGFVASAAVARSPAAIPAIYLAPLLGGILGYMIVARGGDMFRIDVEALLAPFRRFAPRLALARP